MESYDLILRSIKSLEEAVVKIDPTTNMGERLMIMQMISELYRVQKTLQFGIKDT